MQMEEKEERAIACLLQHSWVFYHQHGKEADFGEPCEKCPQNKECKFNWIDIWDIFNSRKEVRVLVNNDIQTLCKV